MANKKLTGKDRFDKIVCRYKKAFEAYNDRSAPHIEYKSGFVYIQHNLSAISNKHRISLFEQMCENLERRAAEKANEKNDKHECSTAMNAIKQINQLSQVQYDLQQQLLELHAAANKLGLYDAADFLKRHL